MTYESLTEGQLLHGFKTNAIYLNDAGRVMGARFNHVRSGFTLDTLEIQSVPQAFVWVTTFPTSDMGEPHTQEHLLLGKGNKGRSVASHETMSLASSTAFTMQWKTCYTFYTPAGADVFFEEFERRLEALLHPDYTDEEIRREVCNFAVVENPSDGSLRLEEKGTVYNEMVTSMDQPGRLLAYAALEMVYGKNHPLSFVSGGTPAAIRVMKPEDIRRFHDEHYHLANMGAIVSVPSELPLDTLLAAMARMLDRLEPQHPAKTVLREENLPPTKPAAQGEIRYVRYPHQNERQPGQVRIVWPANRSFDIRERCLFELFLDNFAGDATTNLYKRFIDSRTRETDFGAQGVGAGFQEEMGHAVTLYFGDVPAAKMNDRDLADVRDRVLEELRRIASWTDGSPDLVEFNNRMRSRVTEMRRGLEKFVNSPPGFGFRGAGAEWEFQLRLLDKDGGFRRSLTMQAALEYVDSELSGDRNIWTAYITRWKLLDGQPWVLAATPDSSLTRLAQEERKGRADAEVEHLKNKYGVADAEEALRRYAADYDAETAKLEDLAATGEHPRFIDDPPMTLDDQLKYEVKAVAGIPLVASVFDSMTSATFGMDLRLDGIPQDLLSYVCLLPVLLTRVGVIDNGRPVSYEEMSERVRKEILNLNADFATNPKTGRVELVVRASGNTAAETKRALEWMRLILFSADWRPENLSRIRDVLDQSLGGLRRTMQAAEESWVHGVAGAFWRQDNPLLLITTSFMTQLHSLYRIRWMLRECTESQQRAAAQTLEQLAQLRGTRKDLKAHLSGMEAGSDALMTDAAKDLIATLSEIPDSSLDLDWPRLCKDMADDLACSPKRVLLAVDSIRKQILKTGNARMFLISSSETQGELLPNIEKLVSQLDSAPVSRISYDPTPYILKRVEERGGSAGFPIFVGLLNPNSQGGVFLHSAPGTAWEDTDPQALIDFLAAYLYGGGGGHSIFMKTVAAGMAYSNGIGMRLPLGRTYYYAERTPELPLTLKFVISEIQRAAPDPALVEYAVAQAFAGTRSAAGYETRGEAMAANLADGVTPEIVTRFHRHILDLRNSPNLADALFSRMPEVYARVLPGLDPHKPSVEGGIYVVIGPEQQLAAWEEYLKSVSGPETELVRLYPRDFWMNVRIS